MTILILVGAAIGGIAAWEWGLLRVTWQDWRVTVGRLHRARTLFFRRLGRGVLVTVAAAFALFILVKH